MKRGNTIFYSMIFLTGANSLLRLAAMGFQVYLSSRIGAAGIGLLQLVLSVSALSFTIGSAGARTCATYLSAGELGRGDLGDVHSVLSGCCRYSLFFGGTTAAALWFAAPWLCKVWIGDPGAVSALRFYALFLPVKCLHGVMTGYFTAAKRVGIIVMTAFLEQGCAIAVTFLLLFQWAYTVPGHAVFSVVAGGCAADVLGFFVLSALCPRPNRNRRKRPPYGHIVRVALPLALADTLRSGLNTMEDLIIPLRLALFAGTVNAMADYGMIRGMVFPVLMFPAAILFSLAELLMPEFSQCEARGSKNRVQYLTKQGLRAALLYGLCTGGLLFALAGELGELLYRNQQVGGLLRLYAPFVPILYMDSLVDALCKGLGQQNANARYNMLTSFLDVVCLWCLLPKWGLGGYYVSFAISHLVNFALSLRRLKRVSGVQTSAAKPALAAAGTILAAGMASLVDGMAPAIGCYFVLLGGLWYLCGVIGKEDRLWLRQLIAGRY